MGYSESDLKIIRWERPDLKIQRPEKYSLDQIIVEFLEKYEVYVKPVTSGTRNRGEAAIAGAITGIAGADVGGDAFLISGQKKQIAVQEWTQWKQWALDHKDFEAFKNEINSKIDEKNKKITEYLESAEFKELADEILAKNKKDAEVSQKQDEVIGKMILAFVVIFAGILFGQIWWNNREETNNSFNNKAQEEKSLSDFYGSSYWSDK